MLPVIACTCLNLQLGHIRKFEFSVNADMPIISEELEMFTD